MTGFSKGPVLVIIPESNSDGKVLLCLTLRKNLGHEPGMPESRSNRPSSGFWQDTVAREGRLERPGYPRYWRTSPTSSTLPSSNDPKHTLLHVVNIKNSPTRLSVVPKQASKTLNIAPDTPLVLRAVEIGAPGLEVLVRSDTAGRVSRYCTAQAATACLTHCRLFRLSTFLCLPIDNRPKDTLRSFGYPGLIGWRLPCPPHFTFCQPWNSFWFAQQHPVGPNPISMEMFDNLEQIMISRECLLIDAYRNCVCLTVFR
ncbi:hypothetical protein OE88DRAFT_1640451 [Heliocybe sulcata]|uniref:Uncharacterized protein n=1 Tax=Heliocybe sulcata TaxID=5364 RepID=A0A5C3NHY7_9AGAM|nr:hypothetical protein OE88DRAFT_1640451 [Heliocybe sulcata]